MMSLSSQIEDDIDIFLDLLDMGSLHTLKLAGDSSDRKISVVIDNDQAQQNGLKSPGGVYDGNLLFYARTKDIQDVTVDAMILFDDVPYKVLNIVEESGISQLTLRAGIGGF